MRYINLRYLLTYCCRVKVNVVFIKYPDECCPAMCMRHCHCCDAVSATMPGRIWWTCRCYMYKVVEHRYFETFIIAMILASSLALVRNALFVVTYLRHVRTSQPRSYLNHPVALIIDLLHQNRSRTNNNTIFVQCTSS